MKKVILLISFIIISNISYCYIINNDTIKPNNKFSFDLGIGLQSYYVNFTGGQLPSGDIDKRYSHLAYNFNFNLLFFYKNIGIRLSPYIGIENYKQYVYSTHVNDGGIIYLKNIIGGLNFNFIYSKKFSNLIGFIIEPGFGLLYNYNLNYKSSNYKFFKLYNWEKNLLLDIGILFYLKHNMYLNLSVNNIFNLDNVYYPGISLSLNYKFNSKNK